jgi:hypothetical protein
MSPLAQTLTVYAVVVVAAVTLQVFSMVRPERVPSLRRSVAWAMRHRSAQLGLVLAWWWLGWHFVTGA